LSRMPIVCRLILLIGLFCSLLASQGAAAREQNVQRDAPVPITLPHDDGPHDAPIEWWYYTGHLFTKRGDRYGFELVVFKGEQDDRTGLAAHFAIVDNATGTFRYDQRIALAPDSANDERETGFDLGLIDWQLRGIGGHDHVTAAMNRYAIDLDLVSNKPPVLHDGDGFIDYGGGEGSYYYSRTRMEVTGLISIDGEDMAVSGEAWFDHQWGNFTTYMRGGWDWYAFQLDDQAELMLYINRGVEGRAPAIDGTYVASDGSVTLLDQADFSVTPIDEWTSSESGVTYPSGWHIEIPKANLVLTVTPSIKSAELDTSATTGVTYWEGEVTVAGEAGGSGVTGLGYVELTGYSPVVPIETSPVAAAS